MRQCTCLPTAVANWLHVLRPLFRHRHPLVCCWWLVCQAIYQEQAPVKGLARLAPRHRAEWHLRRLLAAGSWHARLLVWGFADQVIAPLPPPDAGVCALVGDSTVKRPTAQKPPWTTQGRRPA